MSLYSILTRKKFIKHSLRHRLPLIFASLCLPYKTAAVVSQHTWTPFSTTPLLSLGNVLMKPSTMFIGDVFHVFREKIQMGMQKMKLQ